MERDLAFKCFIPIPKQPPQPFHLRPRSVSREATLRAPSFRLLLSKGWETTNRRPVSDRVPQVRGPREDVLVRGVEVSILRLRKGSIGEAPYSAVCKINATALDNQFHVSSSAVSCLRPFAESR